jgi:hypothetical protein
VTGTWRDAGSASGALSLTQSGSSISGTVLSPPTGGLTIAANSISGSISGNTVNMTWTFALRSTFEGTTIVATTTSVFSLVAASSTAMSGTVRGTGSVVCTGEFCPAPVTVPPTNSNVSLVKQ